MNKVVIAILICFCLGISHSNVNAQERDIWFGTLDLKSLKLQLEIQVSKSDNGKYAGSMFSLDQGNAEMPFDRFEFDDGKMEFEIKNAKVVFQGAVNEAGDEVDGTFTQMGRPTRIKFEKREVSAVPKHVETWKGVMNAGGKKFDFQVRVMEHANGTRSAALDSLSENLLSIPATLEESEGFVFDLPASGARYEGKYSDDRSRIIGTWQQAGGEFDLEFEWVPLELTRDPRLKRPQTPKEPFNFVSEDFFADSTKDESVKLAGTLTLPKSDGLFPAAILISGSGPQDRDSTIYGHKSFLIIADHFAKHGIAVLRYDERGVGQSQGNFSTATTKDFASDVDALMNWLKQHKAIDKSKIVLIGHSEGAIVVPMVASKRDDVDKVIMLAGPVVTGAKTVLDQTRKIAEVAGAAPEFVDLQEKLIEQVVKKIVSGDGLTKDFIEAELESAAGASSGGANLAYPEYAKLNLLAMDTDWFRYFFEYDPARALEKTKCPVLYVIGEKDLQISPSLNLPIVEKIFDSRANKDCEIAQMPGLNHLFQESRTGLPTEYPIIENSFSPKVLEKMVDWIKGDSKSN